MSHHKRFDKICINCEKSFKGIWKSRYCSKECRKNHLKTCRHCGLNYSNYETKDQCDRCLKRIKRYGTVNPPQWNKYCLSCEKSFFSNKPRQVYCSRKCFQKVNVVRKREQYRIENGIDLSLPVKPKKPNGQGHKCSQGYKFVTKMRHPNAQKNGRIYQHIYVMSQHIGRPLRKGETVHHKNGIRDDNRIENLELWDSGHPGGQRVKDKIDWCLDFLSKYGEVKFKIKI